MTRVLIIGGGIVGTALAFELAGSGAEVAVLDASPGGSRGSTAFAPGFIGIFNEAPVLTGLARTSVDEGKVAP